MIQGPPLAGFLRQPVAWMPRGTHNGEASAMLAARPRDGVAPLIEKMDSSPILAYRYIREAAEELQCIQPTDQN